MVGKLSQKSSESRVDLSVQRTVPCTKSCRTAKDHSERVPPRPQAKATTPNVAAGSPPASFSARPHQAAAPSWRRFATAISGSVRQSGPTRSAISGCAARIARRRAACHWAQAGGCAALAFGGCARRRSRLRRPLRPQAAARTTALAATASRRHGPRAEAGRDGADAQPRPAAPTSATAWCGRRPEAAGPGVLGSSIAAPEGRP
mmetsp:Transcript_56869/g.177000  ORF Transcript_56869/g.177000 Transcript_56869/m.177000 type:complete len:204 (+) Transcript_56869:987-1598(+)